MTNLEIKAVKLKNRLNQIFPSSKKDFFCSAIITAAGSGSRMGGVSKQLLPLNGIPCIAYSLIAFEKCDLIYEIIVTAKAEEKEIIQKICSDYGISKLKSVVCGGETRQESIKNGFRAVSKNSDIVAIHDAARPLILPEHVTKLIEKAKRYGAATAAKAMVDTVKRGNNSSFICETLPREEIFSVQTPQVFTCDLYRVALALAERDGFSGTDDNSLAEHAGFSVKLCDVIPINLKLTTKEDVPTISALLKERNYD